MWNSSLIGLVWLLASNCFAADRVDTILDELRDAECIEVDFLALVHSEVFDLVDSLVGHAVLAADGRCALTTSTESYWYDGDRLFSYVFENAQVTVESVAPEAVPAEVTLLRDLRSRYSLRSGTEARGYRLDKKGEHDGPDSLWLQTDSADARLERIEFYDINDELNTIILRRLSLLDSCRAEAFEPAFPDSVEVIRIP